MDTYRYKLANHFHALTKISREDIFGEADSSERPVTLLEDSAIMFAGYVGKEYQPNRGLLLLAINPGGGGDDYERSTEDEVFYPLLSSFKDAAAGDVEEAFKAVNNAFVPIVRSWNLWRILHPTLVATGRTIDEIAYMNAVPYRTRENRMPRVRARRESWRCIVEPSMQLLSPAVTITLGKKAESMVKDLSKVDLPDYCVPRTNGDWYISDEAKIVLRTIRAKMS